MPQTRWINAVVALSLALAASLATMACNTEDPQEPLNHSENQTETNQTENQTENHTTTNQTENHTTTNQTENHTTTNQTENHEEDEPLAEAHQLCAAAGATSGSTMTALNCLGPHDISGFEANAAGMTWQPGAFHVIAQ